ncbi:TetR/AcrR family transcriptional regulator [Gulosibacter macacae]|uniref:TetR/AcrR family transcriptional regulator n=1 Tax=Gulosibacter macacae TaxID=2488791 RepID=A0A3P3VU11_9MICO|nr:TetR/AcrR family transcriptional regulator [Gulosibacter macacae]RRJ86301.1 TetR/AcrR family transcriptional regulator [Gulosibacter macacae]
MNTNANSPARRGRPGNDRRDVILVAVSLFNQHGYEATSVGMIADRLGVSKSAIYHHVSSKEELLSAALDRALSALEATLDTIDHSAERDHVANLERIIRATVDVLVEEIEPVTLLLRLRGNTELERAALGRRREFDRAVAGLVRDADDAGALRADLEPRAATRLIFGMINSITEWYHPNGPLNADSLGDLVVGLVFGGLLPRAVK